MTRYRLERVPLDEVPWADLDRFPDRTVFQTRAWLHFLEESQAASPVVAAVLEGDKPVGWFTGAIVRKFGVRLLGSPLRGFTTSYMGFNLSEGVDPVGLLEPLRTFAFRELGCIHLEVMDRRFPAREDIATNYRCTALSSYEVDLTRPPETILATMNKARRHAIRRAPRNGVTVEQALGIDFAEEHHEQLCDVFAKRGLPPPYGPERIRQLIRALEPTGNLLLVRARAPNGKSIATGIFPALNRTAHFWMGASWRSHQKLLPNEAVQWFVINYWRERGIAAYDMGGGGDYKSKYGGAPITVGWLRTSRLAGLERARGHLLALRKQVRAWRGRHLR